MHSKPAIDRTKLKKEIFLFLSFFKKGKVRKAINKANKIMGSGGRILVRKSGTESKIRIMAESYEKSLIVKCVKIIKASIK